jgi:hypothetical protein
MSNIEKKSQNYSKDKNEVLLICPKCKKSKKVLIPCSVIEDSKNLTTISIQKNLICEHFFQAFVDKDFKVRGYQIVDYELENPSKKEGKKGASSKDESVMIDMRFEGNKVTFNPKKIKKEEEFKDLKEIYEDFWEFIPETNPTFQKFIQNDTRRIHFIK